MKIIVVLMCLLSSFIVKAEDINMTAETKNNQFTVNLPANPTTGYQWQVKQYDQTLFNLVQSSYAAPNTKLVGAGGMMHYTFALKKNKVYPKKTTLYFTYVRPWDLSTATDKKVIVTFN